MEALTKSEYMDLTRLLWFGLLPATSGPAVVFRLVFGDELEAHIKIQAPTTVEYAIDKGDWILRWYSAAPAPEFDETVRSKIYREAIILEPGHQCFAWLNARGAV